jgi:hypothetical protein
MFDKLRCLPSVSATLRKSLCSMRMEVQGGLP